MAGFFYALFAQYLLDPVAWAIVLLLASLIAGQWWRHEAQTGLVAIAVAALLAVTIFPVDMWLSRPLENEYPRPAQLPAHVDGIVVLDGGMSGGVEAERNAPTPNTSTLRILAGVDLARRYPSAKLIYSGSLYQAPEIRALMRRSVLQLVAAMGLPAERVIFEDHSTNTETSFINLRKMILPGQTWLLVTAATHMPRAMLLARENGLNMTPWPSEYVSPPGPVGISISHAASSELLGADHALHEWIGLAAHRLGIH